MKTTDNNEDNPRMHLFPGLAKPSKPKRISAAERWLRSVPKIPDGQLKLCLEIEMDTTQWFYLLQGAAANGWTLERAIEFMIVERGEGVTEWANDEFVVLEDEE